MSLVTKPTINKLDDTTTESSPSVPVTINNRNFPFLVDTGASCNLLSRSTWKKIGTGTTDLKVTVTTEDGHTHSQVLPFTVTDELDILGTNAINSLQLTILNNPVKVHVDNILTVWSDQHLQQSCLQICKKFPDLWK